LIRQAGQTAPGAALISNRTLTTTNTSAQKAKPSSNYSDPNRGPTGKGVAKYQALKLTCQACPSKPKCCPNTDARKITREEHEDARQVAREIAKTKQYEVSMKLRKKVEMLFAHLKRILGLGRLRLRGPNGANDEFLLAATAQNLRKLAKIFPATQQTQKA
jgi:hypothetical protein